MKIKYPDITVKLIGNDENAFAVMGAVKKALRNNNIAKTEIDKFLADAMSSDYNNLLRTCMEWVNVE